MNLFHIKKEYLDIVNQIIENDGELSPELSQALAINESELKEKAVNYGYVIKQMDYDITVINQEIDRLRELKEKRVNTINKLESAVKEAMMLYGIDKVDSPTLKLSFRKSESVEVNQDELPAEYWSVKTTRVPNKTAIKEAIKRGDLVAGAVLQTNQNLQIK